MALERRRPLPAGRYWLDVFPPNKLQWETWSQAMSKLGSAVVEVTEHYDAVGDLPAHDFVVFRTLGPNVAWEAAGLPSPTIAGEDVTTSNDTVQKPPPEPSIIDQASAAAASIGTATKVALGVVTVVAVAGLGVAVFRR